MNHLNFSPFPILKTKRLILRQLDISDNEELFLLRTNEKVNKFIDRPKPINIEEVNDFINKINNLIKQNESIYWSITLIDNPKLIGTICLWNFSDDNNSAEVGYELNPLFHGKGIMDEALKIVIEFGFKSISLDSIEAYTHKNNLNSTKLLLKNNLKQDRLKKDEENPNNIIFTINKEDFLNE